MRERGLKFAGASAKKYDAESRSREGAWIEITNLSTMFCSAYGRSREGAWIEIVVYY